MTNQTVKTEHPSYIKYSPMWKRCRDVAGGQQSVHDAGVAYLPKLTGQTNAEYEAYKLRACFYNATWRTVAGLHGMIYRKPYAMGAPDAFVELVKNIDGGETSLETLIIEILEEALVVGRYGMLVDYPEADPKLTLADSQRLGLRPRIVGYDAECVINWREDVVNNSRLLTLVVLLEQYETPDPENEFQNKCEPQWRVLDLKDGKYRSRVFRIDSTGNQVQIGVDNFPTVKNERMDKIPFYFIGVESNSADADEPPLIDLVDLNLAHYRVTADYEHGCHFTGLPQPWITGYSSGADDAKELAIGSAAAWTFPNEDSKVGYLHLDSGFPALEANLTRKEKAMAVLGARMLEQQQRQVESADTANIHRAGESSLLATLARSVSIKVEQALNTLALWAGMDQDITFELNRDFVPANVSSQVVTALILAWQKGAISKETLFANLQKNEIIGDDITFEDEELRITKNQDATLEKDIAGTLKHEQARIDLMKQNEIDPTGQPASNIGS